MVGLPLKTCPHKIMSRHLCSVKFGRVLQKKSDYQPINFLFFSLNEVCNE